MTIFENEGNVNVDHNGDELKKCVLQYAEKWQLGEAFVSWINEQNTFSNTLVDRIVTGYPKDEAERLNAELGYTDKLLDTAEIFHLWVIKGNFEKELPLQQAGFQVVWTDDVATYKKRKVRILNGAHTSMILGALLAGLETVGDCIHDETVYAFLKKCLFDEVLPTIGDSEDNKKFAKDVLERFANPYIHHQLRSIALNSVSKFSVRVLPTILEYRALNGVYPKGLTMSLAFLIYFYKNDVPQDLPEVMQLMKTATVDEILSNVSLWGKDISDIAQDVNNCLNIIDAYGAKRGMEWVEL
jgi:tagaturonate reductase